MKPEDSDHCQWHATGNAHHGPGHFTLPLQWHCCLLLRLSNLSHFWTASVSACLPVPVVICVACASAPPPPFDGRVHSAGDHSLRGHCSVCSPSSNPNLNRCRFECMSAFTRGTSRTSAPSVTTGPPRCAQCGLRATYVQGFLFQMVTLHDGLTCVCCVLCLLCTGLTLAGGQHPHP